MAFEFKFPDVGEGIHEGTIVKWYVKEGDFVKEDSVIVSVETDKAVVEIPSPKTGTILKLNFKQGEVVKVGEVLVVIGEKNEKISKSKKTEEPKEKPRGFAVVGELEDADDKETPLRKTIMEKKTKRELVKKEVLATPRIRALAKEKNIDINSIAGTGKDGMITENDLNFPKNSNQSSKDVKSSGIKVTKKYDFYGYLDRVPLKGIRKTIADHMTLSQNKAVHVTHMDFADVTHLSEIREKEKLKLQKQGIKLTYLPFDIKAVVDALKEHPYLNANLDEENQEIILKKYYNIGIAVDTEDGLIVPVIKRAEIKKISELAKDISDLSESAKERKIDLSDLKGGTFTITNVGSIGGIYATPIINYPESAILALGKIQDMPLVINNKIEIRKVMPFSLSFDHRILGVAEGARFANKVKEILEDPDSLLFEQ